MGRYRGGTGGTGDGTRGRGGGTGTALEAVRGAVPAEPPAEPGAAPIEAAYRVTPAEIERAVERTGARYLADMETILAQVGRVYEGQLAAKDETIAELRRRAEVAEAERLAAEGERDALRLQLAEASVPPVVVVAAQEAAGVPTASDTTPAVPRPLQRRWQRLWRRLAGG